MTHERTWRRMAGTGVATAVMALAVGAAGAIEAPPIDLVPDPIDGEAVYVPWTADGTMGITIDGDLADWNGLPTIVTTDGPMPSTDPATTGELTWSVVAEGSQLYVSATITDSSIIAGTHEDGFWNEDSIEIFLNTTDDLDTTTYAPGIGQVRFSAVDIGNSDPAALTLSGTGADTFDVEGFVVETPDGWGLEAVIDFSEWLTPTHGLSIGFQVHANGASTLDRDLKLIWSNADTDDLSFDDPSVFGTAVFFELGQDDVPAPAERVDPAVTATTEGETTSTTEVTETTPPGDDPTTDDPTTDNPTSDATTTDATTTDDTAVVDGEQAPADGATDDSDGSDISPVWLGLLALGGLALIAFGVSRLRSSDDGVGSDPE